MSDKRHYELMLLFDGNLPEAEVRKETEEFKKELELAGASGVSGEFDGRKSLAYKVGSGFSGYYATFKMILATSDLKNLEARLTSKDGFLRRFVTRVV